MRLAIKGHETRGAEVIEILEMLGGINVDNLYGDDTSDYYTITDDKEIDSVLFKYSDDKARIFTLEDFLAKFPYKVGDKVYNIIHNENQTITDLAWDSKENEVVYQTNNNEYVFVNYLQLYKEETMEEKIQAYEITGEFCANEVAIEFDPSKFEMIERNGKYFVVKKQPQYPKTYKECCEVLMGKTDFQDFELVLTKLSINQAQSGINIFSPVPPHITLINNFYKLLICRDAYWLLAGKQMGLGESWKPDYTEGVVNTYYTIHLFNNKLFLAGTSHRNSILSFPSEEMRDVFYENFKDLIEDCKKLL